jgi:hypothetical protein
MNEQLFDMYRKASESWFKMQQELFDGLYRSAIHLFQQTSQVPAPKSSEDRPRVAGANGSKRPKLTRKPSSGTPSRSRKATGRRPERPAAKAR